MKKVISSFFVAGLLFSVSGCFGRHKISYDKEEVFNCPTSAKAGEIIRFDTIMVCDADVYVFVNGTELSPSKEGSYEFTMPDMDVTIEVSVVANGLA